MKNKEKVIQKLNKMALSMRKNGLKMALEAGRNSSHIGAGFSIIDIVATLYGSIMKINPENPDWPDRDRFILSKGHGVLGYYTALAEMGFFSKEDLLSFEKTDSFLLGHPVKNRSKGIEFTTGSLGMGLSIGIGVAITGKQRKKDYKVYIIIGDGECNEGSVWESAMAAPQFKLDNLIVIIDKNNFQLDGATSEVMNTGNMAEKWRSFNWKTIEVNGHDISKLYDIFTQKNSSGKPLCIVANTVKGKGIPFAENNNDWHHAVLTKNKYAEAISYLEESGGYIK